MFQLGGAVSQEFLLFEVSADIVPLTVLSTITGEKIENCSPGKPEGKLGEPVTGISVLPSHIRNSCNTGPPR